MTKNMKIYKMTDSARDVRQDVADVFADGYYKDLSFFSRDRKKLRNAFKDTFCPDVFYLAEMEGEIVGILACSNNRKRAMHIDKTSMKKHLGFFMGNLAYVLLRKEFNTPLSCSDNTGYIECVATSEASRGKGVCTALFRYVMRELPYDEYIMDVADTNENAYRLYRKLGFTEYMRKKEKLAKIKGLNERIYMKWRKDDRGSTVGG